MAAAKQHDDVERHNMDFGWSDEEQRWYDGALAVARQEFGSSMDRVRPDISSGDWRLLGKHGVLGASIGREHGGQGLDALATARLFEAYGRGCVDTGLVFAAAAHLFACAMPIAEFGGESIRQQLLPGMCAGDLVAANAMTEPGAGSDVSALETTATRVDGGYVLHGVKSFISNGPIADVFVTYATTNKEASYFGTTAFVVETGSAGVTVGPPFAKLGMASCPASKATFSGCFVPDGAVLGAVGQGGVVFQHSMMWERTCLFALFLGVQARLLDQVVEYAQHRRQFGRRLSDFQSVSNRIVDMKVRLESGCLLLYRACWLLSRGEPDVLASAVSKLVVSEGALASALDAVQLLGGRGYLAEHHVEAALRDAMGGTIFSGTSDIQRQLVARELGL